MSIKSLAALKMEKNFIAVIEKDYPRKPYSVFRINELFSFIQREMQELDKAIKPACCDNESLLHIREEIADVSNCLDYLYEAILIIETDWRQDRVFS